MTVAGQTDKLSEFAERVARAIAADQGEAYAEHKSEYDSYGRVAVSALVTELQYRVTSDEPKQVGDVVEQWLIAAYARGVEWNEENPLDREYRFKAAGDFADKALNDPTSSLRAALTFLADSPSSPASGVRVKALEWTERDDDEGRTFWRAPKPFGSSYYIEATTDGLFDWRGRRYATLVEAKAACQADYEARIRSALGEQP